MNALQEKIERYTSYIEHDHELIAAHPTKTAYKNRLRNHQDKLNRLLEKQERELNPPPYIEPPHHPGITFSEYEALEKELERYATELDEQHDCSVLDDILKAAGIEIPVHHSEMWSGDTLTAWGTRRLCGYDIPLKK